MTSVSVKPSEKSPLAGLRFLVTRQDSPESSLSEILESLGATVLTAPMIKILQPTSWKSFEENVLHASDVDWVIFTSSNGVKYCMTHLNVLDISPQKIFSTIKIACVGHATAAALADHGLTPLLVPEHFQSEGLVSAFSKYDLHEKRCWLIQAESPREILRHALEKMGAQILLTPVYRNVPSEGDHSFLLSELEQNKLDWILFASPSAVQNFHQVLHDGFWESLPTVPKIACLGEITAAAVRGFGWSVQAQPSIQDFEHLVQTLCKVISQNTEST